MSNSTNELLVASWIVSSQPKTITMTCFALPEDAYEPMAQWCQERNPSRNIYRNIVLKGLPEILSYFAPEIAYLDSRYRCPRTGRYTLALYVLSNTADQRDLQNRIARAINVWLARLYPEKPSELRRHIAGCAHDTANWSSIDVSAEMSSDQRACGSPIDPLYYNALVVQTVAGLAGRKVEFESGVTKTLIRRTPQSSPYHGVELVAFPPKQEIGGSGLFTEVVTISAASFPERAAEGLHILARPSLRNWGPIRGYDKSSDPSRSLDIFIPPEFDGAVFGDYAHTSFGYRATVDNWQDVIKHDEEKQVVPRWSSQENQKLFDLLQALTGSNALAGRDMMQPVTGEEGLWILPRLAPGSGDRFLAGGSGIGWPDRRDIATSLDEPMAELGLTRAPKMNRIVGQHPVKGPFHVKGREMDRRQAVLNALKQIGNDKSLDILVLHIQDETPERVKAALIAIFGEPTVQRGSALKWDDDLTVRIISTGAGPFGQLLPKVTLSEDERQKLTRQQISRILTLREREASEKSTVEMDRHLAVLRTDNTVGCAIVEMSSKLKGNTQDPYALGRATLARRNLLPQVVLVGEDEPEEKYKAAVEDCLRMLGVVPIDVAYLSPRPSAIAVASRNRTAKRTALTVPLAARITETGLECAIPDAHGDPEWQPYAHAALSLYKGEYESASRRRDAENKALIQNFVGYALEHIDRQGDALVLLDSETLSSWLPGLQNGKLVFDALDLGQTTASQSTLPKSKLVRINTVTSKLPSYHHTDETQWPTGAFSWDGGERTAYCLKSKPVTMKKFGRAATVSRNLETGDNKALDNTPRKAASMDEICIILDRENAEYRPTLLRTHRLRNLHVQYGGQTRLPFPLHELKALIGALN